MPDLCTCQTNDCGLLVGFDARYDQAANRGYIRHLHCECRSHLYPGFDSIDRLLEVERGVIAEPGTVADLPDTIDTAITLPGTDESRSYTLDGVGNWLLDPSPFPSSSHKQPHLPVPAGSAEAIRPQGADVAV